MKIVFVSSLSALAILVVPLTTSAQGGTLAPPMPPQPSVSGYCPQLTQNLKRGDRDAMTNGQVTELQHFLSDYYDLNPDIYITGYFGRLTQQNVIKFQREQNLPAYGIVGPLTRAAIARACGGVVTINSSFSASPTSGAAPLSISFRAFPNIKICPQNSPYSIDFGDGTNGIMYADSEMYANSTNGSNGTWQCNGYVSLAHTYASSGTYTARLRNVLVNCNAANPQCDIVDIVAVTVISSGSGSATSSTGYIEPVKPGTGYLSPYPDLPIDSIPTTPISVKFLIDHRSAFNGKTVVLQGFVLQANQHGCGPEPCAPRVELGDNTDIAKNNGYYLIAFLKGTDPDYNVGRLATIRVAVISSGAGVNLTEN